MRTYRLLLLLALGCAGVLTPYAAASTIYNYTYSIGGVSALLNLTVEDQGSGTYLVVSISGNRNGTPIGGLVALNSDPNFIYNNLLFPAASPVVDNSGILYSIGENHFNLYSNQGEYLEATGTVGTGFTIISASVSQTPEPASLGLIGVGLLGVGALRRRLHN